MKTARQAPAILHRGSLLAYQDGRVERCLGYLCNFPGHGIFEPSFGRLDVSAEEAQTHNLLLSRAEIEGLDTHCTVGLGGMFYTKKEREHTVVTTWMGEVVSREVRVRGKIITFTRKGMTFQGRLRQGEECFYFKRIQ